MMALNLVLSILSIPACRAKFVYLRKYEHARKKISWDCTPAFHNIQLAPVALPLAWNSPSSISGSEVCVVGFLNSTLQHFCYEVEQAKTLSAQEQQGLTLNVINCILQHLELFNRLSYTIHAHPQQLMKSVGSHGNYRSL
jgi:hypothetical protein